MLQFKSQMDTIENCPPSHCYPSNQRAFRFVFSNDLDNSFTPVLVTDPKRVEPLKKNGLECSGYGLSMYKCEATAKSAYNAIGKHNKRMTAKDKRNKIGDALAVGTLTPQHGLMNEPSRRTGHFDFHPYQGIQIKNIFTVVSQL